MSEAVLDASAILALLLREPGAEAVTALLPGALLSAVNHAEVLSKLCDRGLPIEEALGAVRELNAELVPFDMDQAARTGALRPMTRRFGLSLGDRACLSLAIERRAVAVTTDRAWKGEVEAATGATVLLIRGEPNT